MRINHYRFPENTTEEILLAHGCTIILKDGDTAHCDHIPDEHRDEVDYIDTLISGISVSYAKELLKKYGGCAWTEHFERDGGFFESTPIELNKNNSHFKYNRHL